MKQYLDKIDPKQLRLLLAITMILILFCAYQFGYMKYLNKTETVEEETVVLQQRYDDLSAQVAQEAFFKEGIATNQANMKAIMNQYGPGNSPEKSTKFLIDLSNTTGIEIPTVSFSPEDLIFESTTVPSVNGLGIFTYHSTLSITFRATYQALKDSIDIINSNPEKMNIASISASYDTETGNLSGTLVINQYAMIGTGKTYEPPVIDGVNIGTDSIFGTYEGEEESIE